MILEENSTFCSYESAIATTGVVLADNFEQAFNALGPDNSFAFFDLGLTAEEKEMIDQLDVKIQKNYEHALKSSFSPSYTSYLMDIGNSEVLSSHISSSILEPILKNIKTIIYERDLIFGSATSPEFLNVPLYWHIDQSDDTKVEYRISIALKGPGTMFCKLADSERTDAMNILREIDSIADNFVSSEKDQVEAPNPCPFENAIYQAPSYFGAVFMTGGNDLSAIHTVPIINEKRILFTSFL